MKYILPALGLLLTATSGFTAAAQAYPRTVIAVYDSSESDSLGKARNRIHRFAEMPLNYLGFKLKYYDLQSDVLPSDLSGAAGVFSWFEDDRMKDPEEYMRFIFKAAEMNVPVVMFDRPGFMFDLSGVPSDPALIETTFLKLGFYYRDEGVDSQLRIKVLEKDPSMTEFERKLDGEAENYFAITPADPENTKVYLKLGLKGSAGSVGTPVAVSPQAGIVLGNYAVFTSNDDRGQWRIDPFQFFSEALKAGKIPKYDTTTLTGKRIFYSHIDGDGFRNMYYPDPTKICGQIIYEEILKKYPLPVTVSFITAELEEEHFGTETLRKLAVDILKLPNVEPAVHAFSHPLDWKKKITAFEIPNYSYPIRSAEFEELFETTAYKSAFVIKASDKEYVKTEVDDAVAFVNNMARETGKKVELYLWSGNTSPDAETIKHVYDLNIPNLNGGDSRFDSWSDSYTSVAPLTRQQGSYVQVYSSASNENIYTHGWQGPFYGFNNVIETFKNTERYDDVRGRYMRVAPINIYYHFYIGERKTSLRSIRTVYDYAMNQDIHPVFASEYAKVVEGFVNASLNLNDDGSWTFSKYGSCRTLRFDQPDGFPDMKKSSGVDGYYTEHGTMYVHLSDVPEARLYWSQNPPESPYLVSADASVDNLRLADSGLSFSTQIYRPSTFRFARLNAGGKYEVRWMDAAGKLLQTQHKNAASNGDLMVELNHPGSYQIRVAEM